MKVGIIGATGYGGLELIRFLHNHQEVKQIELLTFERLQFSFTFLTVFYCVVLVFVSVLARALAIFMVSN